MCLEGRVVNAWDLRSNVQMHAWVQILFLVNIFFLNSNSQETRYNKALKYIINFSSLHIKVKIIYKRTKSKYLKSISQSIEIIYNHALGVHYTIIFHS